MVLALEQTVERPGNVRLHSGARDWFTLTFDSMGTDCRLQFTAVSYASAQNFSNAVTGWLHDFEAKYSRYIESSMICEINRQAGRDWVETDRELESMLALCDWFFWKTNKMFDPTAYPLLKLWDYQAESPSVPTEDEVRRCLDLIGWERVEREEGRLRLPERGMALDVGGIGKEYAVDRVFEMALARGVTDLMVNFGHDLRVQGGPAEGGPWRIGLEDPYDPAKCWGGVRVTDRAVCTSGNYLRNFRAHGRCYGHIIDLRTGYPVENGSDAVSVIAPTCTEAGVLATAALVMGPEEGMSLLNSSYQVEGSMWSREHCLQTGRFSRYVIS